MTELAPRPALAGLDLPARHGGAVLAAGPEAAMASVAPFRGKAATVGATLGAALPAAGRHVELAGGGRLIRAGLDVWFVRGGAAAPDLSARLAGDAAVTDQSDGWAALTLRGDAAADVLARLVPLDLDVSAFAPGSAAATLLRHVPCLLLAAGDGFEILVPRSFALTAAHDVVAAMQAVAARARLDRGG